jgi:hypothetical protein
MPIANVDLTNSLEYFRMITNQAIVSWNYLTGNTYSTPGTITINPPVNSSFISLNVANGLIYGNAAQIFSIPLSRITYGLFKNFSLQNTSIVINPGTNLTGGGTLALGNTGTLVLNVSVINSITNTRQDLALAANAVQWMLSNVSSNAARFSSGTISAANGGTGLASFANGQALIGTSGGILAANTIGANQGFIVTSQKGSIVLGANLIQGQNVTFTTTNPLTISRNTIASATTTTLGPVQLNDTINVEGITDQAATANALNAVAKLVGSTTSVTVANGRLLSVTTYNASGQFVYTVPSNFAFAIVTLVGAGCGGGSANTRNVANVLSLGTGGAGGAYLKGIITLSDIITAADDAGSPNTINITVGRGGAGGSATVNSPAFGTGGGDTLLGGSDPLKWMFRANGGPSQIDYSGAIANPAVPATGQFLPLVTYGLGVFLPPANSGARIGNTIIQSAGQIPKTGYVIQYQTDQELSVHVPRPGRSGVGGSITICGVGATGNPIGYYGLSGRENNPVFNSTWFWSGNNAASPGDGGSGAGGWGRTGTAGETYRNAGGRGANGIVIIEAYST